MLNLKFHKVILINLNFGSNMIISERLTTLRMINFRWLTIFYDFWKSIDSGRGRHTVDTSCHSPVLLCFYFSMLQHRRLRLKPSVEKIWNILSLNETHKQTERNSTWSFKHQNTTSTASTFPPRAYHSHTKCWTNKSAQSKCYRWELLRLMT